LSASAELLVFTVPRPADDAREIAILLQPTQSTVDIDCPPHCLTIHCARLNKIKQKFSGTHFSPNFLPLSLFLDVDTFPGILF